MDSLLRIFPQKRRDFWKETAEKGQEVCEIRLRVDRPVIIETKRRELFLNHRGQWQENPCGAYSVEEAEIRELIAYLCQDSLYAYADEIRQGFLTVEGGHRIGLCGQAVLENESRLRTLKNISFVNIRVSHEVKGAADKILPQLYRGGRFQNTLIVSPPGFGKTTLLRDLIRQLSDGNAYGPGLRVGVVYAGYLTGSASITAMGALALSLGIAIQNFPEGAIISMPLKAEGMSRGRAFWAGTLSGAVEPVGALFTIWAAGLVVPALPYLLSFAAGAMIYVVVEELIPEMSQGEHSNIGTICFALGFSVMMVLDVALG